MNAARRAPNFLRDQRLLLPATLLAFLLLGYHPYAEDGGIYAAALEAKLNPALFHTGHAWVSAHTRLALFVPFVAASTRLTHLPLPGALLALQLFGLWATLAAMLSLTHRCLSPGTSAHWPVLLLTAAACVPIAGTALYLVDPYVTARTLTTPLLLGALVTLLHHRPARASLLWLLAALLHPLMAVWALLPLLTLACLQRSARKTLLVLGIATLAAIAVLHHTASPDTPLTHTLAVTRAYWFLSQWHWYEQLGALLPLAILFVLERKYILHVTRRLNPFSMDRRPGPAGNGTAAVPPNPPAGPWTPEGHVLARALFLSGTFSLLLATLFAHINATSTLIARTQPLRTFHLFYPAFLILLAGSVLHSLTKRAQSLVGTLAVLTIVIIAAITQHALYPASGNLELPWNQPKNLWSQAFVWARDHTPPQALFALDAAYTTSPGEDAQGFRAIAQRSALPDAAKDAGIAAVLPSLAPAWEIGVTAQTGLDQATDAARRRRLLPLGITWLVLPRNAPSALPCPYRNAAAQVCRL